MRFVKLALTTVALALIAVASAIAQNDRGANADLSRGDISLGYTYVKANAPPGGCKCFGLNGGYVSASYRIISWLSIAGEVNGTHANDISGLGQDLTLLTYAAGPQVSFPGRRIVPFAQALVGFAQGSDSYFPQGTSYSTTASGFAFMAGGGVDINLNRRWAVRAIKAQYLRTTFPNGTDNEENHLMLSAGLVYKFGERGLTPQAPPAPPPPPPPPSPPPPAPRGEIAFYCSTDVVNVEPGQKVDVSTNTMTQPDGLDVKYTWETSGGVLEGMGREVTINTVGTVPGRYHVTGHAVSANDPSISSSCDVSFRVRAHVDAAPSVPTSADVKAEAVKQDRIFHENVKDAFFDYDKWDIRPDAQTAILHAAEYLQQNPDINVLIGGYSDERGSSEYNLALGLKRSESVRNALVAAGVDPDRLQIISFCKGTQVCSAENEACYQQNRRAAFAMHP